MANLDYSASRGLDKRLLLHLSSCQWIRRRQNVIVTGPTGVGKTYRKFVIVVDFLTKVGGSLCSEGFSEGPF